MPIRTWLMLVDIVVAVTGRAELPGCPAHLKVQYINVTGGQPAGTSAGTRHSVISPVTSATDKSPSSILP
jgi:hypothetical protein